MELVKSCENYFNAFQDMKNWEKNNNWTNAGLLVKLISYFTVVIPLVVLATYAAASLAGRITQVFEPSESDIKATKLFQEIYSLNKSFPDPVFAYGQTVVTFKACINLETLLKEELMQQKKVVNFLLKEAGENFKKFIANLGGVEGFLEKLFKSNAEYLPYFKTSLFKIEDLTPLECILLSGEKEKEYFTQLKAADVDPDLYHSLFDSYSTAHVEVSRLRFCLIDKEEVGNFLKKFEYDSLQFLSKEQEKHYFANLKASDLDDYQCGLMFAPIDPWYQAISKTRFQLIPKEEALNFIKKFPDIKFCE